MSYHSIFLQPLNKSKSKTVNVSVSVKRWQQDKLAYVQVDVITSVCEYLKLYVIKLSQLNHLQNTKDDSYNHQPVIIIAGEKLTSVRDLHSS